MSKRQPLGQHFLIRGRVVNRILQTLHLKKTDCVLEIGPGKGALSLPLLKEVEKLVLVEKDPRLFELLKEKLNAHDHVFIFNDDFLKINWNEITNVLGKNFKVVSNLPYNVSVAILQRLFCELPANTLMVLMFQKEVGERLIAGPSSKAFGSLSVYAQVKAEIHQVTVVSPQSFDPPPKVSSLVLSLTMRERPLVARSEMPRFEKMLKSGFASRRKMLRQNLKSLTQTHCASEVESLLTDLGASSTARAEELGVMQWVTLFDSI